MSKATLSFLWVLVFESIQNLPAMVGMVYGLSSVGISKYVLSMIGMIITAAVIAVTENLKLRGTTLPQEATTVSKTVGYGLLMGVFAWGYIWVSQWGNWKWDLLVGMMLGGVLSGASFSSKSWGTARFWSHTISFSLTASVLLVLLRQAQAATLPEEKILLIIATTAVMPIMIVAIDYGPFLFRKNEP